MQQTGNLTSKKRKNALLAEKKSFIGLATVWYHPHILALLPSNQF